MKAGSLLTTDPTGTMDLPESPFTRNVFISSHQHGTGNPTMRGEERYHSFGEYQSAVMRAIDDLVKDRLMRCEDAPTQLARLIQAGLDAGVPAPHGKGEMKSTTPQCH